MKFDIKSAIIGLLSGIILLTTLGADSVSNSGQIGVAVPPDNKVLVRGNDGHAFVINMETLEAYRILYKEPTPGSPKRQSPENGYGLNLY